MASALKLPSVSGTAPTAVMSRITPALKQKAEENVKKAKVQLVRCSPFFASIVMKRPIRFSETMPTAYITKKGHIVIGYEFAAMLTIMNLVFVLAHESAHYIFLHAFRRLFRTFKRWNIACDAVINALLKESNVGDPPPFGVYIPNCLKKTAEQVYDELPPDDGGGSGKEGEGMFPGYTPGVGNDDLDESDNVTADEIEVIEEMVKQEIATAKHVAKQQGILPAGLEHRINEIINPITPWYTLLEPYFLRMVQADVTWTKPKIWTPAHRLYLPSVGKKKRMRNMGIFRDTSGSCMDQASQKHFLGHINAIAERVQPELITLIDCDAAIHKVREITPDDMPINPGHYGPYGGGGTSFVPPFQWVEKNCTEMDVAVYLTDMQGTFPTKVPEYPVIWLSSSDIETAPFGMVIKYRVTNE